MYKYEIEFLTNIKQDQGVLDRAISKITKKDHFNLIIKQIEQKPVIGYAPDDPNHYWGGVIGYEDGEIVVYPNDFFIEKNVKKK